MSIAMHMENKRVFFGPFNSQNDIDPRTKKGGCPYYNKFVGFFLRLFGIACKITDGEKSAVIRKKKIERWLNRHENFDKKSSFESRIKKVIDEAVKDVSDKKSIPSPNSPPTTSTATPATTSNTTPTVAPITTPATRKPLFPLSTEAKEELKKLVRENQERISNKDTRNGFTVFHCGKHMSVFEHEKFPGLVIKIPSLSNAKEMIVFLAGCEKLVREKGWKNCLIPAAELIEDGDKAIFVMEKVNGIIDADLAEEMSEVEFEKFDQDPSLKAKWTTFFTEAACFICESGYWDVSWRNIILTEKGLAFIDFENLNLNASGDGIQRLLNMAPYQLFDEIAQIARKYGVSIKNLTKEERMNDLKLHSMIRQFHASHSISLNQPIKFEKRPVLEELILNKFNQSLKPKHSTLIAQRTLWCQPFAFDNIPLEEKENFETAIKNLKKGNFLAAWTTDNRTDICTGYTLYF